MKKLPFPPSALVLTGLSVLLLAPFLLRRNARESSREEHTKTRRLVADTTSPAVEAAAVGEGLVFPQKAAPRPLPVAKATDRHEWTSGDGFDPELMHVIAHNPAEFRRLVEENDRIIDRQLVYRKVTVAAQVEAARAGGEELRRITLPALDGRELAVDLTGTDLAPSGLRGTMHGRLAGREQSMVTLAFKGDREAFTVLSPEDGLYLQADPREPGEVVVKRIDPATYVVGRCGTP